MVHLVISLAAVNSRAMFRITQVDQFPRRAQAAGVQRTPTLVIPGITPKPGNILAQHVAYYLWRAGQIAALDSPAE